MLGPGAAADVVVAVTYMRELHERWDASGC